MTAQNLSLLNFGRNSVNRVFSYLILIKYTHYNNIKKKFNRKCQYGLSLKKPRMDIILNANLQVIFIYKAITATGGKLFLYFFVYQSVNMEMLMKEDNLKIKLLNLPTERFDYHVGYFNCYIVRSIYEYTGSI